ncbi:MAG: hypothetical protein CV087_13970 [Candidatus Brocadia sp. WS118]|nr:MAG: hypothetical protein CV087_13970 [Candidatus Brocadia sp. WS118]
MNTNLMNTVIQNEWKEKAHTLAYILAKEIGQSTNELNISEINHLATLGMEGKGFRYVTVQDEEGKELVDSTERFGLQRNVLTNELTRSALASDDLITQTQNDIVTIAAPILYGSKVLGVVRIGFSLTGIQIIPDTLHGKIGSHMKQSAIVFKRDTLLLLPAITFPIMIIGWILIRRLTSPIQQLMLETETIAKGNMTRRIETNSGDDVGKIAHAFNKMIADLRETIVSKEYADNIIKSMDDSLVVASPEFTIQMVNRSTCELLGYNEQELIGKPINMLFSEEDTADTSWFDLIEKDLIHNTEKTYVSKDGRKIAVLFSGTAIRGNNGAIRGIVCVALDITERKRIEAELRKAVAQRDANIKDLGYLMYFSTLMNEEVREDKLVHHMAKALQEHFQPELLAVVTVDKMKNVLDASLITPPMPFNKLIREEVISDPSLCEVIRTGREIIIDNTAEGIPCECIAHNIEGGGYACLPLITGGTIAGMVLIGKKDKSYWLNEEIRKLILVYVGLTASALQRVRLIDLTRRAAITDSLTGAYNRRFFDEMLKNQIALAKRRNESLGLVIADLDHFKNINDTYGHIVGDQTLQQIASIMKNSIRSSDVLARYGGEEFVIIMPSIDITNTLKKAESIREQVESFQFKVDSLGRSPQITISIGVASFPDHGAECDTLIASADMALYKAKKGGRNRVESP